MVKSMPLLRWLFYPLRRLRYPFSLPEDVGNDLGIEEASKWSVEELVSHLTKSGRPLSRLRKMMSRERAEALFSQALRSERFHSQSLFSYYFKEEGWLAFCLHFDRDSRLRRIYLQKKDLPEPQGVEIALGDEVAWA